MAKMLTPAEFAEKHRVSRPYVQRMLTEGRIAGAEKVEVVVEKWQIPDTATISEKKKTVRKSKGDKKLQRGTKKTSA